MADRGKALKGLEACIKGDCRENACPYALENECRKSLERDALELLKAQEPKPPKITENAWIDANVELPKETGTYLVAVKREGDIEAIVLMAWYNAKHYSFGDYGWTLLNEFYSLNDSLRGCITHWMKWPEPPKEET